MNDIGKITRRYSNLEKKSGLPINNQLYDLIQLLTEKLVKGFDGYTPVKGKDYRDGIDGYTPKKNIDYFDGKDGHTPVKGIDYFNKEDIAVIRKGIKDEVKEEVKPVKGVDYLTDEEVKSIIESITPIKNKDYFDGRDGKDGKNGIDGITQIIQKQLPISDEDAKALIKQLQNLPNNDRLDALKLKNIDYAVQLYQKKYGGGSGGASSFIDLTDTPDTYSGQAGKFLRVKSDETGTEFVAGTGGNPFDQDLNTTNSVKFQSVEHVSTYTPTGSEAVGTEYWDATNRTKSTVLENGVVMQNGQELPEPAYNDTGIAIDNGIPVYTNGRHGHFPTINLAKGDAEATSHVFGLTTSDFGTTGELKNGYVTTKGLVRGIKTNYTGSGIWGTTWNVNDDLWVSTTNAGQLTNVEPSAPHHSDKVGRVAIVGAIGTGAIDVNIEHHKDIEQMANVDGANPTATGDMFTWNESLKVWERKSYNINNYVPKTILTDTKEPTGWLNGSTIGISYDSSTRKITLLGTLEYYWRGEKRTLTSPWVSDAHANTNGVWYLSSSDGTNFTWALNTPWAFDHVMVAFVNFGASYKYAICELHGIMQNEVHAELHNTIGTYKENDGTSGLLSNYTPNSTTATNRRPDVSATVLNDEDNKNTNLALTSKLYNKLFLSSTGIINYTGETAEIVPLSGSNPYYNSYSAPNWTQVLMSNNSYMCVWLVALPTTDDVTSQTYRYIWIQGQSNGTLSSQQALTPSDVNLSTLSSEATEFVFLAKVIIQYTASDWKIISVTTLTGNKLIQIGSPVGAYLTEVTTNTSLTGNGQIATPLSINQAYILIRQLGA